MKYIIKESQYVYLLENMDKRKKLFINILGEDLINSIQKISSAKQLPKEFLKSLGSWTIQQYIDSYGPLYYFVLDGEPFIYKDRVSPKGEEYEMYINQKGESLIALMKTVNISHFTSIIFVDDKIDHVKTVAYALEQFNAQNHTTIDYIGIHYTALAEKAGYFNFDPLMHLSRT